MRFYQNLAKNEYSLLVHVFVYRYIGFRCFAYDMLHLWLLLKPYAILALSR